MVGRVRHTAIFSIWKADSQFIRFLAKVKDKTTTSLLATLADFFFAEGIEIVDSTVFLKDYLVAAKNYTPRRKIGENLARDIEFGWEKAWGIAALDIGQTVCVKNRAVVAVEAMEGTDRAIRRAAEIAGPGLVVIKVSRPGHDMRFDVPVVGLSTMALLEECRAAAFVLEAGKTLMLDQPQVLQSGPAGENRFTGENMKIGVIGTGVMGSNHLRVLRSIPQCRVTCAVDVDRDNLDKACQGLDIEKMTDLPAGAGPCGRGHGVDPHGGTF